MPLLARLLSIFRHHDKQKPGSGGRDKEMPCLGEKHKDCTCRIVLLDDTELYLDLKPNIKGQIILSKIFEHLNLIEKDYFGVRYLDPTGQTHWLDPGKALNSQLKCSTPYTLYFGVKFYAADPCKLHEEITRYQFFLQVKRDILQGRLPIPYESAAELCAYAIQSELGDYDTKRHSYGYVSEFQLLPNQTADLEDQVTQLHKALIGQVPAVAEYMFLDKVKWLDMYGVDLHPVLGEGNMEYFLGLTPTGVVVYRNKNKVGNYFWPRISKINFKSKMFMIRVRDKNNDESTYAFELSNKAACKHLWKCCVEHHAFFRLSQTADTSVGGTKLFSLGSKYRYSGRTEKQAQEYIKERPQPQVMRTPSRRQQRRLNSEAINGMVNSENVPPAGTNQNNFPDGSVTHVIKPKHVSMPSYHSNHGSYTPDSPRSTRSAPWELSHISKAGLYTKGQGSPQSTRSEKMMFPRRPQLGSETESEYKYRRRHHRGRSRDTDNESDISGTARKYKRRSRPAESGSESESGHHHRQRHRRSATDEAQWKEVQRRMLGNERSEDMHKSNGSIHSAPGSETSQQRRRRRRHRSRSPNKRPPEELRQHIEFDLVDPIGLSQEQLMDIPFTKVETSAEPFKIKYSPHNSRHRQKSPRRKSQGNEVSENFHAGYIEGGPRGGAEVQYNPVNHPHRRSQPNLQYHDNIYSRHAHQANNSETLIHAAPTVKKTELHTAPIVKTKPVAVFTALAPNNLPHPYPMMPIDDLATFKGSSEKLSAFKTVINSKHSRQDSGLGIDQEYSTCNTKPESLREETVKEDSNLPNTYKTSANHRNVNYTPIKSKTQAQAVFIEQVSKVPTHYNVSNSPKKEVKSPSKSPKVHNSRINSPKKGVVMYGSLNRSQQTHHYDVAQAYKPVQQSPQTHSSVRSAEQHTHVIQSSDVLNCSVNTEILTQVLNSPSKNSDMCTEL